MSEVVPLLKLADNGKVKFKTNHKNTVGFMFGLPDDGGTCSGATTGEGGCLAVPAGHKRPTCYMSKVTQIYKAVGETLKYNTEVMHRGGDVWRTKVLCKTVEQWKAKLKDEHKFFRMNYSGDILDESWAEAWVNCIKTHQDVFFWGYTRSHKVVPMFANIANVTLYISADPSNKDSALDMYAYTFKANNIGICWMGEKDQPSGIKWVTCPETSGKIHNRPDSGACSRCRLCVDNRVTKTKPISFVIH